MRKVKVRLIGIVVSLVLVATGFAVAQQLELSYLTYLDESTWYITVDDAGNAYVTGGDVVTKLAPNAPDGNDLKWEFTFDFDAQATAIVVGDSFVLEVCVRFRRGVAHAHAYNKAEDKCAVHENLAVRVRLHVIFVDMQRT